MSYDTHVVLISPDEGSKALYHHASPERSTTILFTLLHVIQARKYQLSNTVDNYEQYRQQNIVQYCYTAGSTFYDV